jgi:vacuolar protein sorting-associated protein 72
LKQQAKHSLNYQCNKNMANDDDDRSPSPTPASDDDDNESDHVEDVAANGLVATRRKRATAGNLYATLRQNLDDEELQRELMADEEDDEGEYEGSEKDDDDAAMDESDDDEDAGPAKEGEKEDLEGEKELQKAERAAARKKRKFDEARMRLPAWQKPKKKVRLADDVESAPKPKKKSERSNWLPTAADAPSRQSTRASAVANREHVHENLKASTKRSENQKKIMKVHQERQKEKQMKELTQEERMLKAARVEKETMRDFGRWEREEAEKQRIREEMAAAKRRKVIEGPVIRHWSGSVLWESDDIKVKRMPEPKVVEAVDVEMEDAAEGGNKTEANTGSENAGEKSDVPSTIPTVANGDVSSTPAATSVQHDAAVQQPQPQPQPSWLAGIHDYASQQGPPYQILQGAPPPYTPSAPAINTAPILPYQRPTPIAPVYPAPKLQTYHGWSPSHHNLPSGPYQQFPIQPQIPPPLPPPLLREQAQRSLIILDQFESLDNLPTSSRRSKSTTKDTFASTEPTPLASVLIADCYPTLTPEEDRYLLGHKLRKKQGSKTGEVVFSFPAAPEKEKCALTSWPAKYRDPKTGLPYADLSAGRMLRRLLGGGCLWSGFLSAWVGPSYGAVGRAARGVPEGFGSVPKDVKMEGT